MGQVGKHIASAGGFTLAYGEALLKGVGAERFARLPSVNGKVIQTNHPAFAYGHLCLYAPRALEAMGLEIPASVAKPAGWDELFKAGVECRDDPDGTIYPKMEQITQRFFDGYRAVMARLPEVDDAVFARPNPAGGRMAELLPTVGGMVNFIATSHPMSHLGQVSAWRRCVGLGSAM